MARTNTKQTSTYSNDPQWQQLREARFSLCQCGARSEAPEYVLYECGEHVSYCRQCGEQYITWLNERVAGFTAMLAAGRYHLLDMPYPS